jgi:aspartyl-tRNA synthetase
VTVCGWVAKRREHGEHLAFLDVRDHTGIVQCVVPGTVDVRSEYVVAVIGVVRPRPEGTVNPDLPTGERRARRLHRHGAQRGRASRPSRVDDRVEVDEVIRLKHRFVDLRRPRRCRPTSASGPR